ncbi:hypothetical protein FRC07_008340, partial [Ceratobasidium sp. 392]
MKRATTSLHRRLVQTTCVEQSRGYSEAVALRRRQWTRPAETTTTANPSTSINNNNPDSTTPASGSSNLRQVSWDPIPSSRPRNDRPGPGPPRQDRRPGAIQGQGQGQRVWPELPGFNNAPRDRRPDNRRRNAPAPNNNTNNTNSGNGRQQERGEIRGREERLRAYTEARILSQQRASQRQAGSAPWQGVVPPSRSWAVSVPTPGLEDDSTSAAQRGKKKDKTARG